MINYKSVEEALNKEGYIITNFEGVSMYPTFLKDDLLTIIKTNEFSLYDVVLYKRDIKYVVHRIIDIKDDYYVIRGDNTLNDEIVSKNLLLAKVDSIMRKKKEIKLDYSKNINDYKSSLRTLKYRRLKYRIRNLLIHEYCL